MRAHRWLVTALVVGCGDGGGDPADVMADAPEADAPEVDVPMASAPCDPIAQDCPSEKCAVTLDAASETWRTTCVVADGAKVDGQACNRGDGPGDDDCVAGAFCTFYSVLPPALGGARVCREHCTATEQCAGASGDVCVDFGSGLPTNIGLCVPSCAPFVDTCGAGLDCSQPDRTVDGQIFLYCRPLGAKALGASCDVGDVEKDECVAGAMCLDLEGTGAATCIALCDDRHPCVTGTCASLAGAPDGAGYCTATR